MMKDVRDGADAMIATCQPSHVELHRLQALQETSALRAHSYADSPQKAGHVARASQSRRSSDADDDDT